MNEAWFNVGVWGIIYTIMIVVGLGWFLLFLERYKFRKMEDVGYHRKLVLIAYREPKTILEAIMSMIRLKPDGSIKYVLNNKQYGFKRKGSFQEMPYRKNNAYKYRYSRHTPESFRVALESITVKEYNLWRNNCNTIVSIIEKEQQ